MSELAQNEQVNTNERIGSKYAIQRKMFDLAKTRLDTRLTQSRADGQGPYTRCFHHLGRSFVRPSACLSVQRLVILAFCFLGSGPEGDEVL